LTLSTSRIDEVLEGGARWAVDCGYGTPADLERIEEKGCMAQARPQYVSPQAKKRQSDEVGTLGSGNHYLEVQKVTEVCDANIAQIYGIKEGDVVISIHCGSRGLGHQIATDFLPQMVKQAASSGIELPDRELACAPISSRVGQEYLAAMRCGVNCALANRQVLTHLCRRIFDQVLPKASLTLLYDVSHNTCKVEEHCVDGKLRTLHVHRKGATRAFGPNHPSLPPDLRKAGQPVLIGGTMGTASYILAGTETGMSLAFGSCCHGAGRAMSRRQAKTQWQGKELVKSLAHKGIIIRGASYRGIAEEAPGAYKDVTWVVDATEKAGLAKKVAKLEPVICVKG
jgi:tRNA-splicing ligase RtcB